MRLKRKTCPSCQREKTIRHSFYNKNRSYCILCERKKGRVRMRSIENKARMAWRHACEKAEKLGIESTLSEDDVIYLFKLADGRCAYTGEPSDMLSLEHVIPMTKGGKNAIDNVIIVDLDVNRRKYDGSMMSYVEERCNPHDVLPLVELLATRGNRSHIELYDELFAFQKEESEEQYRKIIAK